jgi:hypothetical protein
MSRRVIECFIDFDPPYPTDTSVRNRAVPGSVSGFVPPANHSDATMAWKLVGTLRGAASAWWAGERSSV